MPPRKTKPPDTPTPLPPATDPEAERTALGAILLASPPWPDVEAVATASDFASEIHRRIFRAAGATANGHPLDPVTILAQLRRDGDDDPATASYLTGLLDGVPKSSRWATYLAPVHQLAAERRRRLLADEYARCGDPEQRQKLLVSLQDAESVALNGSAQGLPWIDLTAPPEPGKWLVRGIIPEQGRLLLVAPSGVGKSWVLADLALAVATGSPWLGLTEDYPVAGNRGPVLIVDEESAASRTRYRLARLAAARGLSIADLVPTAPGEPGIQASCLAGVNIGDPRAWGLLLADVRRLKPCLVILDAAIRFIAGNENESQYVGPFWSAMGALQVLGPAVAVAHHTGWVEKERARGSTDWHGGADVVLTLSKTDEKDRQKLSWTKMKDPPDFRDPEPIYIDREGHEQVRLVCGGSADGDRPSGINLESALIECLAADDGRSRAELIAALRPDGTGVRGLDAAISKLRASGKITTRDRKYYLA